MSGQNPGDSLDKGATLRSDLADDPDMSEVLELFICELPRRVETVLNAWTTGEVQGLKRIAHQLKGSCAGYGFPTIGSAAERVEAKLDAGTELKNIRLEVDELVDLCRRAARGGPRAGLKEP